MGGSQVHDATRSWHTTTTTPQPCWNSSTAGIEQEGGAQSRTTTRTTSYCTIPLPLVLDHFAGSQSRSRTSLLCEASQEGIDPSGVSLRAAEAGAAHTTHNGESSREIEMTIGVQNECVGWPAGEGARRTHGIFAQMGDVRRSHKGCLHSCKSIAGQLPC